MSFPNSEGTTSYLFEAVSRLFAAPLPWFTASHDRRGGAGHGEWADAVMASEGRVVMHDGGAKARFTSCLAVGGIGAMADESRGGQGGQDRGQGWLVWGRRAWRVGPRLRASGGSVEWSYLWKNWVCLVPPYPKTKRKSVLSITHTLNRHINNTYPNRHTIKLYYITELIMRFSILSIDISIYF